MVSCFRQALLTLSDEEPEILVVELAWQGRTSYFEFFHVEFESDVLSVCIDEERICNAWATILEMGRYFTSEKCLEINLVSGGTLGKQIFVTEDVLVNLGLLAFIIFE